MAFEKKVAYHGPATSTWNTWSRGTRTTSRHRHRAAFGAKAATLEVTVHNSLPHNLPTGTFGSKEIHLVRMVQARSGGAWKHRAWRSPALKRLWPRGQAKPYRSAWRITWIAAPAISVCSWNITGPAIPTAIPSSWEPRPWIRIGGPTMMRLLPRVPHTLRPEFITRACQS